ncbi:hypothetical protein Ahy_A06g027606 isoform A [Arachis hypogaea]|uniref:Protein FAR1-RELATED SEQUENCE n=1 Tax=Arachis hypogaea TaxID=3818 RepID=A0A445CP69_ARAHY|nr:hypothetical protein Ahy_A06g027606 isoform A [Arachis hypogaea]
MLKQHRELSMFVCRTIETNKEARIRPSKTYQSFVAAASKHRELSFIEKDVRNYITSEVRNVSEQDDANEFRKYLVDARSRATCEYFGDVVSFDITYMHSFFLFFPPLFTFYIEVPKTQTYLVSIVF